MENKTVNWKKFKGEHTKEYGDTFKSLEESMAAHTAGIDEKDVQKTLLAYNL